MNSAAEEYFHLNSQGCWVIALVGVIIFVVAYKWRNWPLDKEVKRQRTGIAAVAMVVAFAMLPTSYFLYSHIEDAADVRDAYVVKALKEGGVTFEGFQDQDTERVRVSRMVGGKKCSATFNVVLGDYEGSWPLRRGSGRFASSGCELDDVQDTSGLRSGEEEGLEGARSFYLDKIFAPVK